MRMIGTMFVIGGVLMLVPGCSSSPTAADAAPGAANDAGGADAFTISIDPVPGGHITYSAGDRVYRIDALSGAGPIDISAALDAAAVGSDGHPAVSRDGAWLVLSTNRPPACRDESCMVRFAGDLTELEVVVAGDAPVSPDSRPAINLAGDLIVFPLNGEEHDIDLFVTRRRATGWTVPELLTGSTPHQYNERPVLSPDEDVILFDCGPSPYQGDGNGICEIGVDGSGFRRILDPSHPPTGIDAGHVVEHGAYTQDGSIVFEADWDGEAIWVLAPGASEPHRVSVQFSNDNTPCVLPNGYIASLWLGRAGGGGLHELKTMAADGSNWVVLTPGVDVTDIGLSCHDKLP